MPVSERGYGSAEIERKMDERRIDLPSLRSGTGNARTRPVQRRYVLDTVRKMRKGFLVFGGSNKRL